jgi:catechol 2,3-dioxygenase-like lactoylglutathione lyase family enzyme
MFSHVRIGSNDIAKTRAFYDSVLGALGIQGQDLGGVLVYDHSGNRFVVAPPRDGSALGGNGATIGFNAASIEAVQKFHAAGMASGGTDEGAPGPRPYVDRLYAAYLRDPDGYKICALTYA